MSADYPPDPGGVFASDYHRRVAAHLPVPAEDPISIGDLMARLTEDAYTGLGAEEGKVVAILDDLAESSFAKFLTGAEGWRLLKGGLDALSGPALTDAEEIDGKLVRVEPGPLEGKKLEEAEAQQKRIAEEGDEAERTAAGLAVERAREALAAAEATAAELGVS